VTIKNFTEALRQFVTKEMVLAKDDKGVFINGIERRFAAGGMLRAAARVVESLHADGKLKMLCDAKNEIDLQRLEDFLLGGFETGEGFTIEFAEFNELDFSAFGNLAKIFKFSPPEKPGVITAYLPLLGGYDLDREGAVELMKELKNV